MYVLKKYVFDLQGIIELYEFQKQYPHTEAKVNTYLSQTGTYFQSYIRRGLSNLAAEDNDIHAQAAATVPTPAALIPSVLSTPQHSMEYVTPQIATTPNIEQHHHYQPQQHQEQRLSAFELHQQQSRSDSRSSIHAGGKEKISSEHIVVNLCINMIFLR